MSLRIAAPMTLILHLPRSRNPVAHSLKNGLHRRAVMAGKYRALRNRALPIFESRGRPLTLLPDRRSLGTSPA